MAELLQDKIWSELVTVVREKQGEVTVRPVLAPLQPLMDCVCLIRAVNSLFSLQQALHQSRTK